MREELMYMHSIDSKLRLTLVSLLSCIGLFAILFIRPVVATEIVPLVIVNGDTISTADMDLQLMQVHRKLDPQERESFDYSKLISKQVNDRLIIQEATAIGMDVEDKFVRQVQKVQMSEARKVFARQAFSYDPDISEKEILEYFNKNYFKVKLRTLASHDCDEVARYAELIRNGVSMDSLAKEVSLDTRRYLGGAQSLRFWSTIEEQTRRLVENLKVGQLCQPFPYKDACMIIRLDERIPADTSDLPQLIDGIKAVIDKERRVTAWAGLIDSLSASYSVEIDSAILQDIQDDSTQVFRGEFNNGTDRPLISAEGIKGATDNDVRGKISHKAMNASDKSFREILDMTVTEISETIVLDAAAEFSGSLNDPKVLDIMRKTSDSLLIENYLQENVVSKIKFNQDQFKEYYDANQDQFRETGDIRLYDLQVADEATAQLAMERLKEGADFNYVSKELGIEDGIAHDENAWMKSNQYPEQIASQLDSLAVGEYTNPLQVTTGWVIFKVRDRRPGALKTIESVDLQIREIMFQREFKRILDEVLGILKENSEIEYFDKNINAYFGTDSDS